LQTIDFTIPKEILPTDTHDNIRFKRVGAYFLGDVGHIPWKIELKLPLEANFIRDGQSFNINQTAIPKCILGRVGNLNIVRNIEYCGVVSLNNGSPIENIGNFFDLSIIKPKVDIEKFNKIEDLIIEFNLTGKL
jgi:hypothetical protein